MSKILIIGAGAMGSAFAIPCLDNNHDVNVVGTHLENDFINELKNKDSYHPGLRIKLNKKIKIHKFEKLSELLKSEIDLIVYKNAVLSFVEVKFRSHSFSDANEVRSFLPKKKRKSLVRGASFFLTENNVESFYSLRFDLFVLKGFGNKGHLDFFYTEDVFCGDSLCFH